MNETDGSLSLPCLSPTDNPYGIEDFRALGLLPELDGVYRRDYLQHLGYTPADDPGFDAVFLTHAHIDLGYVHFLRPDIPIYCTPTTAAMMEVVQDTGSYTFDEFVEMKTATSNHRRCADMALTFVRASHASAGI